MPDRLAGLAAAAPAEALIESLERSGFAANLAGGSRSPSAIQAAAADASSAFAEALGEQARSTRALVDALAARSRDPAPQQTIVHVPESIVTRGEIDAAQFAQAQAPLVHALDHLAAITVAEGRAAREPAWIAKLLGAIAGAAERIEGAFARALERKAPPRTKTITLPDGRVFTLTERDEGESR